MIMRLKVPAEWRPRSGAARTLVLMKLFAPVVLLVCLVLAGCGGDDKKASTPSSTPAAQQAATEEATASGGTGGGEEGVKAMFDDYRKALVDRDWDRACSHLAPETTDKLKSNIKQLGVTDAPEDCPKLMDTLYAQIDKDPTAKKTIDAIAKTAKVTAVKITGDTASVSWTAKVNGVDTPVTQSARIIDGEWKLIDVN